LRASIKEFEKRDVQIIALVPNPPGEWQLTDSAKTEAGEPAFPILADPAVTVAATFGQGRWHPNSVSGNAGAMVIDREGVVRFHHPAGKDFSKRPVIDRPAPERLLQVVDGFRANRALVEILKKDADANLKKALEVALGPLGPDAKTVVPEFVEALQSDSVDVRLGAVAALWLIAPEAPKAVPALGIALKDRDPRVRRSAAEALWILGPIAKTALPAVVEALRDKDADVRTAAGEALWVLGPDAKAVVKELAASLKDDDAESAKAVAFALTQIGPTATQTWPAVVEML
jgi:HEAT repeats